MCHPGGFDCANIYSLCISSIGTVSRNRIARSRLSLIRTLKEQFKLLSPFFRGCQAAAGPKTAGLPAVVVLLTLHILCWSCRPLWWSPLCPLFGLFVFVSCSLFPLCPLCATNRIFVALNLSVLTEANSALRVPTAALRTVRLRRQRWWWRLGINLAGFRF